jgi:hypothetical protein
MCWCAVPGDRNHLVPRPPLHEADGEPCEFRLRLDTAKSQASVPKLVATESLYLQCAALLPD